MFRTLILAISSSLIAALPCCAQYATEPANNMQVGGSTGDQQHYTQTTNTWADMQYQPTPHMQGGMPRMQGNLAPAGVSSPTRALWNNPNAPRLPMTATGSTYQGTGMAPASLGLRQLRGNWGSKKLPPTRLDSLVGEAMMAGNAEMIYGDEGIYMPPFNDGMHAGHSINSGIISPELHAGHQYQGLPPGSSF